MKITIDEFEKSKDFLVCVDSDGCAMDTMDVKHIKCFGPKIVEVWGLQVIEEKFLETWNYINLYSKTRGINRFKGLVKIFEVLTAEGMKMPEFSSIKKWTETTPELSNPALEKVIEESKDDQLIKALEWSNGVNKAIRELHNEDKPFPYVKEGLEIISKKADIAIVSSANGGAVMEEWTRHELAPSVQVMLGQEVGTKAACIAGLKEKNFSNDKVLMVGDAPGDLEAALKNGVLYYPILVGKEEFSWKRLATEALEKLMDGTYKGEYQEKLIDEFNSSLK
ncbi:HAD family hydrolase [Clostridium saccharoperbutylacetonicum]|uniref:HAD family hydrolase n=1 Tax=Clostridium saccharoperbutylacetonicum TaxID=36745 RepID=UPI0039EC194C